MPFRPPLHSCFEAFSRDIIPQLIVVVKRAHLFALTAVLIVFSMRPALASETAEQEYYTIQVASFKDLESTLEEYYILKSRIDAALFERARIEYIPPFYTIRIGRSLSKGAMHSFMGKVLSAAPSAVVLQVNVIPDRFVLSADVDNVKKYQQAELEATAADRMAEHTEDISSGLETQEALGQVRSGAPGAAVKPAWPEDAARSNQAELSAKMKESDSPAQQRSAQEVSEGGAGLERAFTELTAQQLYILLYCGAVVLFLAGMLWAFMSHRRRSAYDRSLSKGKGDDLKLRNAAISLPDGNGYSSNAKADPTPPLQLKLFSAPIDEENSLPGLDAHNEALLRSMSGDVETLLHNYMQQALEKRQKSIYVTSCQQGEGKTRVSVSLAHALAAQNFKVLLADADIQGPVLGNLYGIRFSPGLLDLLKSDSARLRGAIYKTSHANLHLLPLGSIAHIDASESQSLPVNVLIREMSKGYDFVIIDGQPLRDPFAKLIASACDGVLLVAPWRAAKWHALRKAIQDIALFGGDVLGVVQNKRDIYLPPFVYRRTFRNAGPTLLHAAVQEETSPEVTEVRNAVEHEPQRFLS